MELVVKHFNELCTEELLDICRMRVSVFVVEQKCPYQEIDYADKQAYHIYLKDDQGIQAYARVLPQGVTFDEASVGRVIAVKRRCTPEVCIKKWDSYRYRSRFWKTAFSISSWSWYYDSHAGGNLFTDVSSLPGIFEFWEK